MLLGALVDLGVDESALEEELDKLKLPGFKLEISEKRTGGIVARKVTPRFGKKTPTFRNSKKNPLLLLFLWLPFWRLYWPISCFFRLT